MKVVLMTHDGFNKIVELDEHQTNYRLRRAHPFRYDQDQQLSSPSIPLMEYEELNFVDSGEVIRVFVER